MPLSASSAVILQYHHVSSDTAPITSLSKAEFLQHMNYLKAENFTVISLPELVKKIRHQQPLDDKTVAITFDDGYLDVYDNARPILKRFDWPYTIFVNPKFIDGRYEKHITWAQLRQLSNEKATIANHSMLHEYFTRKPKHLSESQWLQHIKEDVNQAESRISKETGQNHKMVAYPYGEFYPGVQKMLKDQGYIAFGQHSGAFGPFTDLTRIPRFPASGVYANLTTLTTKLASLPLPVTTLVNANPIISQNPPTLQASVITSDFLSKNVQCFASGAGRATVNWLNDSTFTVTATSKLGKGRSRYNCTAPSLSKPGRYYWFSQPWLNML